MLVNFFHGLKDAGVPVTPRELLDLIEGLKQHIAFGSMDEFYYFSRTCMVKDESTLIALIGHSVCISRILKRWTMS